MNHYQYLSIFRKERGIENSVGNLMGNIKGEIEEALQEISSGNTLKLICEFCDIAIYNINALEQLGHDAKSNVDRAVEDSASNKHSSPSSSIAAIFVAMSHYLINKDIKALALIASVAMNAIESLGYSAEMCLCEKAKCINSRIGMHDLKAGRWIKDENQDPSTLYVPDYKKCKRG